MLVTTKIKIDLQRPSYPVVVNAVQGDQNTRQLEISLFSGSVAWMVPDNVAVAMRYCKPDNTNGYYDTMPDGTASFAVSENTVSVLLAPQMLTVPGTVVAQVVLYLGTQTLATFAIYIRVEADPSAGAVTSEDYVNWAQWIKSELDAYLEKLKTNGEFVGGTFVGDVNMNGHALSGLREPVAPDDAATKEYVDKNASTGAVSSVAGVAPDENGNVPLDAASVKALPIGGGTMEGPINMNGQPLSGLNAPTKDDEAANKGYVDQHTNPPLPGVIYPYSGANIPDGFLLCDGAAYSRTEYAELFAAIGTMYGSGDGSTTFNVPDLVERVPAGAGDNHAAGEMVGEETHTLTVDEMPAHTHTVSIYYKQGTSSNFFSASLNANYDSQYSALTGRANSRGGSQPHNIMQPTTYIRGYIIATGKGSGVSVQDIITGVQALPLGVQYGGTGATNLVDARKNLGLEDTYDYAHNSDFTQWVNQAGFGSSHAGSVEKYAGDRWILDGGTVTGNDRGDGNGYTNITLNGTIRQIVANAPDVGTAAIEMVSGTANISYTNGQITISSNGGVIKNVRLFKGNCTADNMAPYQPKGYGAELVECMRYYVEDTVIFGDLLGMGQRTLYYTPVPMRTTPTCSVLQIVDGNASPTVVAQSNRIMDFTISANAYVNIKFALSADL